MEEEWTVLRMSQMLGVSSAGVSKRLRIAGRKPYRYLGSTGLYREDDFLAIKDAGVRGRPKASGTASKQAEKASPKAKPKKPAKKS